MSDQKPASLYQQQKATKPLIESVIPEYLDGDTRELALDFVAHMRANKMKPTWTLTNQWKITYKTKNLCRITLTNWWNPPKADTRWVVTAYLMHLKEYEETVVNENLQRFLWDNVFYCVHKPADSLPPAELRNYALTLPCNIWNCAPGKDITVCGKELTNICRNGNRQYFWFRNPDKESIDAIKRLLDLEKTARDAEAKNKK